jgi:hypothetical protein
MEMKIFLYFEWVIVRLRHDYLIMQVGINDINEGTFLGFEVN